MESTQINMKAPIEFKKKLEEAAKKSYMSNSDYIRIAVLEKIRRDSDGK